MSLSDLINTQDFEGYLSAAEEAVQGELLVISHDLRQLRSLGNHGRVITDSHVLDSIIAGDSSVFDGRRLDPILSRDFPLLVAMRTTGTSADNQHENGDDVALAADLLREFFDDIESRRRDSRFTPEAQMQWSMLPVRAARTGSLQIAGTLQPASSVAGDAYDFAVNVNGNLTTLVMDAMGHGVTATLSSSLALATIRTVRRDGGTIVDQVSAADRAIIDEYGGERFVTVVVVEFDSDCLRVVNAGHEPIRRLHTDGSVTILDIEADPPLGLDGLSEYRMHTLEPLGEREGLALLSDGASEAADPGGRQFGAELVNSSFAELRTFNCLQTADRFSRAVMNHVAGPLHDDLTVVVAQRTTS